MARRILIAVDFSAYGRRAFLAGVDLARDLGASVVLVHAVASVPEPHRVTPPGAEEVDQAKAGLRLREANAQVRDWAAQAQHDGVDVLPVVDSGPPADVVLQVARHERVHFIVMGTHGHAGVKRMIVGSVADKVLRNAPCPVVVVPAPA